MSVIKDAFVTYLKSKASITALVGQNIHARQSPSGTPAPRIVYKITDTNHEHAMGGAVGQAQCTIEVNVYAETPASQTAVTEALRNVLDGFNGSWDSVRVQMCHLQAEDDDETPPSDGSEKAYYVGRQAYFVGYTESIPNFT